MMRTTQGLLVLILMVSAAIMSSYASYRAGLNAERRASITREIDDLVNEIAVASDDDLINGMPAGSVVLALQANGMPVEVLTAEDKEPERSRLAEELIDHFKKLAARAITPYGCVIVETVMVRNVLASAYSIPSKALVVFQTEDGHWWQVDAERNEGGSWSYRSPIGEGSPLTYDTEASLSVVPPRPIEPSKQVRAVTQLPSQRPNRMNRPKLSDWSDPFSTTPGRVEAVTRLPKSDG